MGKGSSIWAWRFGAGAAIALAFSASALFAADGASNAVVAPVQVTSLGNAGGNFEVNNPKAPKASSSIAPATPTANGFSASPASGQMVQMPKMFEGKQTMSDFNTQRSPFDGKMSPFDMKSSSFTDMRAQIGGRDIYAPMLDTFDKRIDPPQATGFSGMSPMSGAATTAAGAQVSSFDAKRAQGFDKTITVPNFQGKESEAILNPKPFSEGMKGGDPATAQFIRGGGNYGATISLEEVRDLINKDAKGASLQIPIPAGAKP